MFEFSMSEEEERDGGIGSIQCRKLYYSLRDTETGNVVEMDWCPYFPPTEEDLVVWINLGMPDRMNLGINGPLNHEHLLAYAASQFI